MATKHFSEAGEIMAIPIRFKAQEVVSYTEMCSAVGASLQRGMNFRLCGTESVILMSRRSNAPYVDRIEDDGRTLVYEGHDCARRVKGPNPKMIDQPAHYPGGSLTQNGLFSAAVKNFKAGGVPERVHVFEKIHQGIWVYNGIFELVDCWVENAGPRRVFKFKLQLNHVDLPADRHSIVNEDDDRIIPTRVKLEVWKRDQGRCIKCGTQQGLHFDHIIPYSKGGSSKDPANIQILCARHNLQKRDNIE